MAKSKPIAYEPHPVSPERKAELIDAGYRILDARFAPKDATTSPETPDAAKAITREDIASMKKADVAELLDAHGVEADGKIGEMRERLEAVMFVDA